jgi:hypothetical protein
MRKTCHGCPHLQVHRFAFMGVMPSCGAVEEPFIVPHRSELQSMAEAASDQEYEVTYWRVPEDCPLSASEVHKSKDKAPVSDWQLVTLRLGDVEEYTP